MRCLLRQRLLRYFGSTSSGQCKGDNGYESDIDLALEAGPGFSLIDAGMFQESVERACNRPVDIVCEAYPPPSMRETLRREMALIYER